MMKINFYVLFILPLFLNAQINVDSIVANNAYGPGEKLLYKVSYGLIKGGEAMMSVEVVKSGEDFYYYLKATAYTTGLAANFAYIDDTYESWVRITTGFPVKAARNITENRYIRYDEYYFYRNENFVYDIKYGKKWIPTHCFDILSAFYYARQMMFRSTHFKDELIDVTTYHENKVYPIKIKYKKTETIRTKFGKVRAHLFVPVLEIENPFEKEDDFRIWISADGNYIPVKLKAKLKVGNVSVELIGFENLKNPFKVEK